MATTKTTEEKFNGTGSQTVYPFTIEYILTSDLQVFVSNVLQTEATHYSISGTNLTFKTAPASGTGNVRIARSTGIDKAKAVYAAGSSVRAVDLNDNQDQFLFKLQERENVINAQASSTAPTSPVNGDRWYDTVSGRTYVYYTDEDSSQWVEASPPYLESNTGEITSINDANVVANAAINATKLSFTAAKTGAVARTVDSKLEDIVSVEDFGAVGDGVTDDTAAIQAAIDWAESQKPVRGGTILLGPKKYATTAPLIIDHEGVTIEGVGTRFFSLSSTSSIIGSHTTGPIIHVKVSSTRLKGFRIDSSGARLPSGAYNKDTQVFSAPAINSSTPLDPTKRNDGIHCVANNNGAATADRISYVLIDDMHVRGQPGSGIIICGHSVGCHIKNTICEYNNSHNVYIGRGDEAGYAHTAGNRIGIVSVVDCSQRYSGGNNLLVGDVITDNIDIPYRVRIVNNEAFRCGYHAANLHDSLDFGVILIGENIGHLYGAVGGRGGVNGGTSGEGNGLLVGGRNITVDNNRFINTFESVRVVQTNADHGTLSKKLGLTCKGVTVNMPIASRLATGNVNRVVYIDNKTEFSNLNRAPEGIKVYAPHPGEADFAYDETDNIKGGVLDYSLPVFKVDTEASASTDDLDTILGGTNLGDEITLFQANSAREVKVKHGTGNIRLAGGVDFDFNNDVRNNITLIYNSSVWCEKSRTVI